MPGTHPKEDMNTHLDLVRPALVLVDLQNDNVHPDGAFASSGAPAHAAAQGLVEHVGELLSWARDRGLPVIHNHIVAYPGRDFGGNNAPIFQMIGPDSLKLGSWGGEPLEGLEPLDGEPLLLRNRMSAFNGSGLDALLRNLGVESVVVAGVWTNMAVEHTVRDAADHGYRAVLVTDATSSINEEWQNAATGYALTNIAQLVTTADVVAVEPSGVGE
jgi:nicotinamidase-related amidase